MSSSSWKDSCAIGDMIYTSVFCRNLSGPRALPKHARGSGTAPLANSLSAVLQSVSIAPLWDSLDTISLISFPCSFSIFFTSWAWSVLYCKHLKYRKAQRSDGTNNMGGCLSIDQRRKATYHSVICDFHTEIPVAVAIFQHNSDLHRQFKPSGTFNTIRLRSGLQLCINNTAHRRAWECISTWLARWGSDSWNGLNTEQRSLLSRLKSVRNNGHV